MGAFDDIADQVNRLEPDTRWRGLGDIIRHFYLVKLRDDANYDVLAFSTRINLENISGRDSVFHVRKTEFDHPAIASVVVDGQTCPFQLHEGYLDFNIPIPAGQARSVAIQYENHLPSPPVVSKKNRFAFIFSGWLRISETIPYTRTLLGVRSFIFTTTANKYPHMCLSGRSF